MANRDPISYTLYIGLDYNDHDDWPLYGVYPTQPLAVKDTERLTVLGWRVKIVYLFANGVTETRIVENGHWQPYHVIPTPTPPPDGSSPVPSPPPPSSPPPGSPPPAFSPSLDFTEATNSMYAPSM